MAKTLYLMRHGETLFNVQKKNQGWCDAPLTERGIAQARIAGRYFSDNNVEVDHFFSSTSERASDTLEHVCEVGFGRVPAYERLKGLKEWNFGAYEGKDSFLNPPAPFGDFFVQFGGDSQQDLVDRMVRTCTAIMERPDVHVALAVSHGAACANFARAWHETNVVQYHRGVKNCSIFRYLFDEEARTFSCVELFEPDLSELG